MNKSRITREIVETIRSRGGRLLKRVVMAKDESNDDDELEEVLFELVDEPVILEKAKQALREKKKTKTKSDRGEADGSCWKT